MNKHLAFETPPKDPFGNYAAIAKGKADGMLQNSLKMAALGLMAFGGFNDIDVPTEGKEFLISIGVGLTLIASMAELEGRKSLTPVQEVMQQIELNFGPDAFGQ